MNATRDIKDNPNTTLIKNIKTENIKTKYKQTNPAEDLHKKVRQAYKNQVKIIISVLTVPGIILTLVYEQGYLYFVTLMVAALATIIVNLHSGYDYSYQDELTDDEKIERKIKKCLK